MKVLSTAGLFSINWRDLLKGLAVAMLTPVFTILITSLEAGQVTFNWRAIGLTALAAGAAYLLKNFLSPTKIVVEDVPKDRVELLSSKINRL